MVRQRQADLLLIAATVIAACGWIFSARRSPACRCSRFLGCVFLRRAASAAVLPRFSPAKAALAKTHHQRTLVCAQPLPVDLFGLHDGVARRRAFIMSLSMMFVPLTAWVMMKVRPPRAWWECLPIAVVGLGLLSLHMPIAFHPSQGWFC
nr:Uncharacterised protein [Klebsiella pneumoniae]